MIDTTEQLPQPTQAEPPTAQPKPQPPAARPKLPPEIGGAPGPEPTRYGDWQHKGRCTDF